MHHTIPFVSSCAQFNLQEMALILWAFAKVQQGDNVLFGMVAKELMRQTKTRVMGVVGGGGGLLGGMGEESMEGGRGVHIATNYKLVFTLVKISPTLLD